MDVDYENEFWALIQFIIKICYDKKIDHFLHTYEGGLYLKMKNKISLFSKVIYAYKFNSTEL